MSVFGGVICCISAFYEYGQNAAKRKGAPLVCFGFLPGGGYYTHDGANTDTQRRACLCSVVHVVYIRAGGVEALASCCIKGAFGLKNRRFGRGYVRAGAVCLCSVVHVVHIGRGLVTSSMCGVCPNCLYLSILCPVLRLWPPFALLWIWTHNGANMDTARAVPYSLEHPFCFVKIIRLVLCSIKRRALAPLRVSFVCVVPIRGGLPGAACISNTSGESKRRMPRALLDVVRILSTLSIS